MVVGGTGHQNIPGAARDHVREGIRRVLDGLAKPFEGASALAVGTDQLFAECVLEEGGRLHVVVPSRHYETTFAGPDRSRYIELLAAADSVEVLDYPEPSEDAFLAAGMRVVDLCDLLLAVWDGRAAEGRGGTADVVAYARKTKKPVEVIWPEGMRR